MPMFKGTVTETLFNTYVTVQAKDAAEAQQKIHQAWCDGQMHGVDIDTNVELEEIKEDNDGTKEEETTG